MSIQTPRQSEILEIARHSGHVTVDLLAADFDVELVVADEKNQVQLEQ